jgi:integrase
LKLKYLVLSRGLYHYQRRYPQHLLRHPQIKGAVFKRSLEVNEGASEENVLRAWRETNKAYEDFVSLLQLANIDALEQSQKIELANALLEANKLKPGMLAPDPLLSKEQNSVLKEAALEQALSTGAFDDLSHFSHPEYVDGLTPQVEVASLAWKIVNEPARLNTGLTTLSSCWDIYRSVNNLDDTTDNSKMAKTRFLRFIQLIGDQVLTQQTCNAGLRQYVETREDERQRAGKQTPTQATIQRELNAIIAILNTASQRKGLELIIRRPALKKTTPTDRYTFTKAELVALAALAQNQNHSLYAPWKELMLLIMVQTGVIQSELQRLRRTSMFLDHAVPHIDLTGQLKTTERARPNPLVFKLERIRELVELLDNGSGYVFGKVALKEPKTVNKALVRICQQINPAASPYSCRHAFKNNALGAGVNPQLLAALGGWSGKELGFNSIMADYGKTGVKHLETLQQLRDAMLRINLHLLSESGQVIHFPARA